MERQSSSDPTPLTTQQILREVSSLKELIVARIEANERATALSHEDFVRFPTELQKAISTLQNLIEAKMSEEATARTDVQRYFEARLSEECGSRNSLGLLTEEKIRDADRLRENLRTLILEKFDGVSTQFSLRDKGVKETAELTNLALQAALSAAEKSAQKTNDSFVISAAKTEASFTKTQDAQAAAVSALSSALNDKLQDQKERITAIESRSGGIGSMAGWIAGGLGLFFSLIMAAIAVISFFHSPGTGVVVVPPK